jgi:hypothetical protein
MVGCSGRAGNLRQVPALRGLRQRVALAKNAVSVTMEATTRGYQNQIRVDDQSELDILLNDCVACRPCRSPCRCFTAAACDTSRTDLLTEGSISSVRPLSFQSDSFSPHHTPSSITFLPLPRHYLSQACRSFNNTTSLSRQLYFHCDWVQRVAHTTRRKFLHPPLNLRAHTIIRWS